jgi:hypothetical protein
MKLVLGTFARGGIEAFSGRDLSEGVQMALRHYAGRQRRDLPKRPDRPLLRTLGEEGLSFELAVDSETEKTLECRAREYGGVSVEELATHAVLVYLADCDAQLTASTR